MSSSNDARDVIMTFWTDVLVVDDKDNDNDKSIFTLKRHYKLLKRPFVTFWTFKIVKNRKSQILSVLVVQNIRKPRFHDY